MKPIAGTLSTKRHLHIQLLRATLQLIFTNLDILQRIKVESVCTFWKTAITYNDCIVLDLPRVQKSGLNKMVDALGQRLSSLRRLALSRFGLQPLDEQLVVHLLCYFNSLEYLKLRCGDVRNITKFISLMDERCRQRLNVAYTIPYWEYTPDTIPNFVTPSGHMMLTKLVLDTTEHFENFFNLFKSVAGTSTFNNLFKNIAGTLTCLHLAVDHFLKDLKFLQPLRVLKNFKLQNVSSAVVERNFKYIPLQKLKSLELLTYNWFSSRLVQQLIEYSTYMPSLRRLAMDHKGSVYGSPDMQALTRQKLLAQLIEKLCCQVASLTIRMYLGAEGMQRLADHFHNHEHGTRFCCVRVCLCVVD